VRRQQVFVLRERFAKDCSQWSTVLDMVSGISFFVTAVAFVAIVWRGSYWLITRVTKHSVSVYSQRSR
jgi:hypothetical protein